MITVITQRQPARRRLDKNEVPVSMSHITRLLQQRAGLLVDVYERYNTNADVLLSILSSKAVPLCLSVGATLQAIDFLIISLQIDNYYQTISEAVYDNLMLAMVHYRDVLAIDPCVGAHV